MINLSDFNGMRAMEIIEAVEEMTVPVKGLTFDKVERFGQTVAQAVKHSNNRAQWPAAFEETIHNAETMDAESFWSWYVENV